MSILDAALAAADLGLAVFPVRPLDKRPLRAGWQDEATTDAAKIARWFAETPNINYGIRTGLANNLLVVDLDGPAAQSWWNGLGIASSAKVSTPSGPGRTHLYFRVEDVEIPNSQKALHPSVDTRGEGGYVVGPGSILRTGSYSGSLAGITNAPPELLALMPERHSYVSVPRDTEQVGEAGNSELRQIASGINELDALPRVWIEGAGWRSTFYRVSCWFSRMVNSPDYALTEGGALSILMEHVPTDTEWGEPEAYEQWQSARKSTAGQYAPDPTEPSLRPVEAAGRSTERDELADRRAERAGKSTIDTAAKAFNGNEATDEAGAKRKELAAQYKLQILARTDAEAEIAAELYDGLGGVISWADLESYREKPWLVEGLISAGEFSLLVSKRNIGKSMLAFSLAFSVATGLPFLGRHVQRGAVLLVLGEGTRGFAKRMRAWCAAHEMDPEELKPHLTVYQGGNLSNATSIADIKKAAVASRPVLIVIDTWTALNGIEDEVKQSLQQRVVDAVKLLAPDAAKLVLHHPNGETEDTEAPKPRGGTALPSAAETVISMFYDRKHNVQELPGEKWIAISTEEHHGGKQKEAEQVTIHGLRIVGDGDGKFMDHYTGSTVNSSDQWVMAYVTLGKTVTVKDLETTSGAGGSTIRRHLKGSRLVRESLSKTGGPNEYLRAA